MLMLWYCKRQNAQTCVHSVTGFFMRISSHHRLYLLRYTCTVVFLRVNVRLRCFGTSRDLSPFMFVYWLRVLAGKAKATGKKKAAKKKKKKADDESEDEEWDAGYACD